jgi:hypothetical protein
VGAPSVKLAARLAAALALTLAIFSAALLAGCGSPSTCAELGSTTGVAANAAALRLEVYAAGAAHCSASQVSTQALPLRSVDFAPTARLQLDLPPGVYVVHLLAYQDTAGGTLAGEGCSLASIGSNQSTCLSLNVTPAGCTVRSHSNGVNGTYQSCAALGAWDNGTATLACTSAALPGATCTTHTCSGGGANQAICGGSDCTCWTYTGPNAGTVRNSPGGGCDCGQTGVDPTWN